MLRNPNSTSTIDDLKIILEFLKLNKRNYKNSKLESQVKEFQRLIGAKDDGVPQNETIKKLEKHIEELEKHDSYNRGVAEGRRKEQLAEQLEEYTNSLELDDGLEYVGKKWNYGGEGRLQRHMKYKYFDFMVDVNQNSDGSRKITGYSLNNEANDDNFRIVFETTKGKKGDILKNPFIDMDYDTSMNLEEIINSTNIKGLISNGEIYLGGTKICENVGKFKIEKKVDGLFEIKGQIAGIDEKYYINVFDKGKYSMLDEKGNEVSKS